MNSQHKHTKSQTLFLLFLPPFLASWLNISLSCLLLWHSPANQRRTISALLSSLLLPGLQPCLQLPATLFIILSCLFVSVCCKFEKSPLPPPTNSQPSLPTPQKNIVYIMLNIYVIRVQRVQRVFWVWGRQWTGSTTGRTLKSSHRAGGSILQPSEAETFSL